MSERRVLQPRGLYEKGGGGGVEPRKGMRERARWSGRWGTGQGDGGVRRETGTGRRRGHGRPGPQRSAAGGSGPGARTASAGPCCVRSCARVAEMPQGWARSHQTPTPGQVHAQIHTAGAQTPPTAGHSTETPEGDGGAHFCRAHLPQD